MRIKSSDGKCLINSANVVDVYCTDADVICLIKASKPTVIIGHYNTSDDARYALQMLFNHLNDESYEMPKAESISNLHKTEQWHHATGKKVKRKGGS